MNGLTLLESVFTFFLCVCVFACVFFVQAAWYSCQEKQATLAEKRKINFHIYHIY